MKPLLLLLMSFVIVINLAIAQRSPTGRPEAFYFAAGLMLFGALLAAAGIGE